DTDMGRLGKGMSGIADLDGDGLDDVLAAAPGEGATRAGRVHIRSGTDGALIDLVDPDDLGDFPNAQEFGRFFLFDAGDLNLDGVHDLYICDMFDDEHGFTSGRLYVVSGADRSLLFEREGDIDNGWFSVGRPIGDQNNDGRPDLLVSTLGSSDGGFRTGRVQIYSGADGSLVREITSQRLSPPPFSLGYGECFGWDAINAGDVNGDGVDDIFATAPYWNSQGPELGHGYLILGKPRCPADVTSIGTSDGVPDGAVDLSDIALYLSLWTTGGARADVTGDGACDPAGAGDGVTLSDFACYLSQWSIGCPPAT
ncbi:MAG: GC-type dockerin domain-anchored protein, partial [Planctomycetota bacterium]